MSNLTDEELKKLYMSKGHKNGTEFDLREAMEKFSFRDLYYSAPLDGTDVEGCVVITPRQVITSYSKDLGRGAHIPLYARIMKELQGGGIIPNYIETVRLATNLKIKYIVARIDFYAQKNEFGRVIRGGGIYFLTNDMRSFTQDELKQFMIFYTQYNESIKWLCSICDFKVTFMESRKGPNGVISEKVESGSLDLLKDYITSRTTEDEDQNGDGEVILSVPPTEKQL